MAGSNACRSTPSKLGLREGRFQRAEIPDSRRAARTFENRPVQRYHFPERQVAHQARRLYRSLFLVTTRRATS